MEVLIPLLMFLVPLVITILDKRAKAQKTAGSAQHGSPAIHTPATPLTDPESASDNVTLPLTEPHPESEGQRAINRLEKTKDKPEEKKLEIDKKKLILYSEILKPKFDE